MSRDGPKAREAEWVELFRSTGRNEYFDLLYKHSRKGVYRRCFQLLRNRAEAEDLTHEVFLRAYEKFSTLKGDNFSGWVGKIASNLCLNSLRNRITHRRLLQEKQPVTEALNPVPIERRVIQAEQVSLAREIIATLRPEHRKVLLLKCLEGFTYREIEQITGYNENEVRSHLQNAKRNFKLRWQSRATADDIKNGS